MSSAALAQWLGSGCRPLWSPTADVEDLGQKSPSNHIRSRGPFGKSDGWELKLAEEDTSVGKSPAKRANIQFCSNVWLFCFFLIQLMFIFSVSVWIKSNEANKLIPAAQNW